MKFRRFCAMIGALSLLAGCRSSLAGVQPDAGASLTPAQNNAVRTGLAIVASTAASRDASADDNGLARTDLTMVALTIDEGGVIDQCAIDGLQAAINFDASGRLTTAPDTPFPSKNELGRQYGMHNASGIGREWNEQAAAFAAYACGKTVNELAAMALNGEGRPAGAELSSTVTISVSDFLYGIQAAAQSARHLGAQKGDALQLACLADASASTDGLAQLDVRVAAFSLAEDKISSCVLDSLSSALPYDESGHITADISAPLMSKQQADPAWSAQADALCAQLRGKTPDAAAEFPQDFEKFRQLIARLAQDRRAQVNL